MASKPIDPAKLLKQVERLEAKRIAFEEQMKRDKDALAKKLIEAAQALAGDNILDVSAARRGRVIPKKRRRYAGPSQRPVTANPVQRQTAANLSGSWTATILNILDASDGPLTYRELRSKVMETHLGPILQRTEKSFYGAVAKLEGREQAVRHNGRVFSMKAYGKFQQDVAAGRVKDEPLPHDTRYESPTKLALLKFLEERPRGATAAEIIAYLAGRPDLDIGDKNRKTAVYNLLSRLVKRERLEKSGGRYKLIQKDEAPGSEEPSAPNHHGDGSGTPSSSGNVRTHPLDAFPGANPAQPGE